VTDQERWAYRIYLRALNSQYNKAIANIHLDGEASVNWIQPLAIKGAYEKVWPQVSYTHGLATTRKVRGGKYNIMRDPWKANTLMQLDTVAGERITEVWATSRKMYVKALQEATVTAANEGLGVEATQRRIRKLVNGKLKDDINIWRARRIAQTEVIAAGNFGSVTAIEAMNSDGLQVKKQWQAIPGAKTERHFPSMDGQVRAIGQPFDVFGEAMQYPGDPNGSAENVINCRCSVQPYIEKDR